MSEDRTHNLPDGRSFEERVFARFDTMDARFGTMDARFDAMNARFDDMDVRFEAMDARFEAVDASMHSMDARLQVLEARAYDTKPMWEQALKEIMETRRELTAMRREVKRRLDRIDSVVLEVRADLGDAEDRIERLESKSSR